MLTAVHGAGGMVSAPHGAASEAGLAILRRGGTAVEAAVATAAALAVVYPHMNSIGGDSFWLIHAPGAPPLGVDASGRAGSKAHVDLYRATGLSEIPTRGPLAANTVAGAVSGWARALELSADWRTPTPLEALLEPAIAFAEAGSITPEGMAEVLADKAKELGAVDGFAQTFLAGGVPASGTVLRQPALGRTLRRLARHGLDDFYRGGVARDLAADLEAFGAPVTLEDLERHAPVTVSPLSVRAGGATLFNLPAPTQGLASLLILALFDRIACDEADGFDHVHGLVEATKQAFRIRDAYIGDPDRMTFRPQALLGDVAELDRMARAIDPVRAAPWPHPGQSGDTVWFGAIDGKGRSVSVIQSTYFEFGSGLVLPQTGVTWQNRGASFRLTGGPNLLEPGRKPFHTLNPAMALFEDGRRMVYGTMGGEGQPQTQAAIFTRYAHFGQDLQAAVSAPRWLLGRTWGEQSTSLKLEGRFDPALAQSLRDAGHVVEVVSPMTSMMGHAGAVVREPTGALIGAADPRSDGAVAAF